MRMCEVAIAMKRADYERVLSEVESVLSSATYCYGSGDAVVLYWDSVNWEWEYNSIDAFNTWMDTHNAPWRYLLIERETGEVEQAELPNSDVPEMADFRGFFEPAIVLKVKED